MTAGKKITLGLVTRTELRKLDPQARVALLEFIGRFTDIDHVASIDLGANSSTITVFSTDSNGYRYLVDSELARVSWEIDYGLEDVNQR